MKTKIDVEIKEITFGVILILVSLWMFIALNDFTARFVGGGIVSALGTLSVASGIIHICR